VLTLARNVQKEFLMAQKFKVTRDISPIISGWLLVAVALIARRIIRVHFRDKPSFHVLDPLLKTIRRNSVQLYPQYSCILTYFFYYFSFSVMYTAKCRWKNYVDVGQTPRFHGVQVLLAFVSTDPHSGSCEIQQAFRLAFNALHRNWI